MLGLTINKKISTFNFDAGNLTLSNFTADVYRYDYPTFAGESLINYSGTGTVNKTTITADTGSFEMNKFDPTYITLVHGATLEQSYISEINTNLVFKISFSVTYSTPIDYSLVATKNSSYTAADGHYGISSYLQYCSLSSATYDGLTTDKTADNDKVFYKTKTYADDNASLCKTFGSNTSLDIYSSSVTSVPSSGNSAAVTTDFVFYFNVDFDATSSAFFFQEAQIGKDFTLDMDYTMTLKVSER